MSRVALIGENSIEYIDKLIDIWDNGDCAVLIDWRIPLQTAVEMMHEAEVHTCCIDKKFFDKVPDALSQSITFIPFERKTNPVEYLPESIYDKFKPNYSESEAVILYSSGTTGKSKGIILSHFAINTNADAIIDYMKPNAKDCIYIAKTLSHSSTLTGELLVSLKTYAKLVIAPTIVPPRFILNNIKRFNVTIICLNPILLSMFADEIQCGSYDISSLRTIYVSGSILNDKIYSKAHDTFKEIAIYNVYGLSEAGPRVTAQCNGCRSSNSAGKPIQNVEIAIVAENGTSVTNGEHGVVHVNTPSRFAGYISGQAKHKSLYKDWLNTGDIGYIDCNGELHIVGRIDDVIILDAHKIYPGEIENTILDFTEIAECVVVKVEYKNNKFIGCLCVGRYVMEQEIKDKLKNKLPTYEIPRRFIRCDSIPRTLNGKTSKTAVKEKIINAIETEQADDNK